MKWGVEGAGAADVDLAVDVVVGLIEILTMRITLLRKMVFLEAIGQMKRKEQGGPLRGMALVVHVVSSVVVVVVVLAMERMLKASGHVGYMNVAAELDVGKSFYRNLFSIIHNSFIDISSLFTYKKKIYLVYYFTDYFIVLLTGMRLNVKELVGLTGELLLMK